MDIEEKIKAFRQEFEDINQNMKEITEELKLVKISDQENKEKLIVKEKEIEQMLEDMKILEEQKKILEEQLALQIDENHTLKTELFEKNEESKYNERDIKVLWTKLNGFREKLRKITDNSIKDQEKYTQLQPKEFISDAGLKLETSNELQKYTDKSKSCNEEIFTLKKMLGEKTEEINDLKLEMKALKEDFNNLQIKMKEYETKVLETDNEAENNEIPTDLFIPGLKEMILDAHNTGQWNSCMHMLELNLKKNTVAFHELSCIKNIILLELSYKKQNLCFPLVAAQFGCKNIISIMLFNGLSVNIVVGCIDNYQCGMLQCAVKFNHFNLVELLISSGANINGIQSDFSPLLLSLKYKHQQICKLLITKDVEYCCVLMNSVLENKSHDVEMLLKCGIFVDKALSDDNKTALHYAASKGFDNIAKILINMGANVNAVDKYGNTPLHITMTHGFVKVFDILVNAGVDINVLNDKDETPLHVAVSSGHVDNIKKLVKCGADVNIVSQLGNTPLHLAAEINTFNIIDILVNAGADVHVLNNSGETPLHVAVSRGHVDTIKNLLKCGADVSIVFELGNTPLHLAAEKNIFNIIEIFVNAGADVNVMNNSGETPLHVAVSRGHVDIIKNLLTCGADVNIVDQLGNTPLHVAIVNRYGNNPLMYVSQHKYQDIIKVLVNRGSDINKQNKDLETPLHLAAMHRCKYTITYLVNHNHCNKKIVNKFGQTALTIYTYYGCCDRGVTEILTP